MNAVFGVGFVAGLVMGHIIGELARRVLHVIEYRAGVRKPQYCDRCEAEMRVRHEQ